MENSAIILFTLFGLLVGSFLNALIYRLPRDINIAYPRSSCTSCKKLIYWYENIPLLSYIFLKGECSGCRAKISPFYPFVEFIVALFAFSIAPKDFETESLLTFFFFFSLFCAFLVHFIIDLKHQILPDSITIYISCLFLIISVFNKPLNFWLLGGLVGLCFPLVVTWIFYKIKGQVGLGGGDIKLFGALGIYLGPVGIMQNIFLSCFLGAVIGLIMIAFKVMKKESPIPFGPFIIVIGAFQIFTPDLFEALISYIP